MTDRNFTTVEEAQEAFDKVWKDRERMNRAKWKVGEVEGDLASARKDAEEMSREFEKAWDTLQRGLVFTYIPGVSPPTDAVLESESVNEVVDPHPVETVYMIVFKNNGDVDPGRGYYTVRHPQYSLSIHGTMAEPYQTTDRKNAEKELAEVRRRGWRLSLLVAWETRNWDMITLAECGQILERVGDIQGDEDD